ncbi:50S ribosomal protein L11 methyltransferase [Crocinitomicaceae bacterium]|nr:50S ribosomal protein L11 methyltransferase [Crocinitomicaceae bacterium]
MDTIELTIKLTPNEPWSEIIVAELSEVGFESFVHTDECLIAYSPVTIDYDDAIKQSSLSNPVGFKFEMSKRIIPTENWNAKWEENFDPVYVEKYASILAPFHDESLAIGMRVIIQPKMSFGTGHHQTTWMMSKALFELNEMPKNVLDMGTGTGVLAIISENLGADRILAIDIESGALDNAIENTERNHCSKIECLIGDVDLLGNENFGLVIANINKNILKVQMQSYSDILEKNGVLLLSGFFKVDVQEMLDFASNYAFEKVKLFEKDEWAAIQLKKM